MLQDSKIINELKPDESRYYISFPMDVGQDWIRTAYRYLYSQQ